MQYDQEQKAHDMVQLSLIWDLEVGSQDWLTSVSGFLSDLEDRFISRDIVLEPELTLQEKIAMQLGLNTEEVPPPSTAVRPINQGRPDKRERVEPKEDAPNRAVQMTFEEIEGHGVKHNVERTRMEQALEESIASGNPIVQVNPPAPNMGYRASMASTSPALVDPKTGEPWLSPSA